MEENNDTSNGAVPDVSTASESLNQESAPQQDSGEAGSTPQDAASVDKYKTYAILGYILPFLFFLPLMNESSKNNPYARFHANQHLILLVAAIAVFLLHSVLFSIFMFAGMFVMQTVNLAFLALAIIGIINASKGTMKGMPLIGGFTLLK
ncbi:MAG: putative membrane protein [Candidatus Azotimanducaceae bacterium]|jgi:uncharacterized membrane protein